MRKTIVALLAMVVCATTDGHAQPFAKFQENANASIKPQGWLGEFLNRQRTGLTGHPEALSYPYNTCLWGGEIIRRNSSSGAADWWCYEQTAYYTDGLLRLGYLLDDKQMIAKGEVGIAYTIDHAAANGRLGNAKIKSIWPMCVFFRAMLAEYERTGNPAIPKALERNYLSLDVKTLNGGTGRHIINLEGLLWTYGKTQNQKLLDMAEEAFAMGGFHLDSTGLASKAKLKIHGVTYAEELKLPVLLYAYTGKQKYLDLALNAAENLERWHLLPDGVPSSAEHTLGLGIDNAHETCDIADFTWTWGYFLAVTGNAKWADRIERAIFNAGLGCITKDFKALQYFSSVNQVLATGTSNNNDFMRGRAWMAYRPFHQTECCAGNVHRYMPNFAWRTWMTTSADNGVIAAMYAPSQVSLKIKGMQVSITEKTAYPFDGRIEFVFHTPKKVAFPFTFRIPAWATSTTVTVNGKQIKGSFTPQTFATLNRKFANGDRVVVSFGMKAETVALKNQGIYVQRGPLLYTYAIKQNKVEDLYTYPYMKGKRSANPDFKCWSLTPTGSFSYGVDPSLLPADGQLSVSIDTARIGKGYPFDLANNPIKIQLPVRKTIWEIEGGVLNPTLPSPKNVIATDKTETIELVPYGCSELRLTVFPIATPDLILNTGKNSK